MPTNSDNSNRLKTYYQKQTTEALNDAQQVMSVFNIYQLVIGLPVNGFDTIQSTTRTFSYKVHALRHRPMSRNLG
jgi:hypothetical protein